ncbi:MAG: hypothetical protein ACTHLW_02140 [Verrucomicrobiota bacterium]
MSDTIEIKIDAKKLTPDRFLSAVESFFALVQGVSSNVAGDREDVHWVVEVERGSAVVRGRVTNPTSVSQQSIDAICWGLRSLQSGSRSIPAWFTNEEVRSSKRLADLIDGDNVQTISIKNGAAAEPLSRRIVESADAILTGENYQAFGSIEGKVDSLSDKTSLICSITDPIYQREITCYFTNKDSAEEAVKGFRKRVLASGLIRYGKEGHPTSISVDKVHIFPDESELPTVEQIQEIYKRYAT